MPSRPPPVVALDPSRSVLLEHSIPYASNAKKADLIAAFLDGVYAQRAKLLKNSLKSTKASGRGIVLVPTPSVADSESIADSESARSESSVCWSPSLDESPL